MVEELSSIPPPSHTGELLDTTGTGKVITVRSTFFEMEILQAEFVGSEGRTTTLKSLPLSSTEVLEIV